MSGIINGMSVFCSGSCFPETTLTLTLTLTLSLSLTLRHIVHRTCHNVHHTVHRAWCRAFLTPQAGRCGHRPLRVNGGLRDFAVKSATSKKSTRTPPPASLVPLVLNGPLCPAGISVISGVGSEGTTRSPLPCGHLPTPWGVTPFRGGFISHQQKSPGGASRRLLPP